MPMPGPFGGLLLQKWRQITSIQRLVTNPFYSGQCSQRRHKIDRTADLSHSVSRAKSCRPANVTHGPHTAFVGAALLTLHTACPAVTVRSVVRKVDDNRVVVYSVFFKSGQHAAYIHVLVLDHRQSAPRVVLVFCFGIGCVLSQQFILEAFAIYEPS
jgi:hypothetical protein